MNSFSELPLGRFIEQAASGSPVPGGGGIAALAGALGGAMAAMAANFTVGKPKFAHYEAIMRESITKLEALIIDFQRGIDDDARAFSGISQAYGLPNTTDEEKAARSQAVTAALTASMQVPLQMLRTCAKAVDLLPTLAGAANPNLLSDVEVAAIMIDASARAAWVNILVNSRQLQGSQFRTAEREAEEILRKVRQVSADVTDVISGRSR